MTESMTALSAPAAVLAEVLSSRYSCRAFTSESVPADVLRSIFETAQQTASWCNAQSWQVDLVSGASRDRLSEALLHDVLTRPAGGSDIPIPGEYRDAYLQRRRAAGFGLYGSLGIARDDREARRRQNLENYRFFGAPHVALISSPQELGPYGYIDCGGFVTNVLNVAHAHGVATIAQASVVLRPQAVRSVVPIPQDRHLVCGVALGYAMEDHPANRFRTERAAYVETVNAHD